MVLLDLVTGGSGLSCVFIETLWLTLPMCLRFHFFKLCLLEVFSHNERWVGVWWRQTRYIGLFCLVNMLDRFLLSSAVLTRVTECFPFCLACLHRSRLPTEIWNMNCLCFVLCVHPFPLRLTCALVWPSPNFCTCMVLISGAAGTFLSSFRALTYKLPPVLQISQRCLGTERCRQPCSSAQTHPSSTSFWLLFN